MVYIEPTSYINELIKQILILEKVDVIFLDENRSQNWNLSHEIKTIKLPLGFIKKPFFIFKLLKNNKYSIIHIAGWNEIECLMFIFLGKFFGSLIAVESDTPLNPYTNPLKKILKKLIYPTFFKLINIFLPGGIRQAQYFEHYKVNKNKIHNVQMTVDVSSIKKFSESLNTQSFLDLRNKLKIPQLNFVFLFVGRLTQYKGILELIKVFKEIDSTQVSLVIVGDGELKQEIQNKVTEDNRILYLGRLANEELYKIYYLSNILVLPSYFEPWGLVVNEAMALSKAVIVSDQVGCVTDLVKNNITGIIYPSKDYNQLKVTLEYAIKNATKCQEMGKNAFELISTWTLENEARNICQTWQQQII